MREDLKVLFKSCSLLFCALLISSCAGTGLSAKCKTAVAANMQYINEGQKIRTAENQSFDYLVATHENLISQCNDNPRTFLVSHAWLKDPFFADHNCSEWDKNNYPKFNFTKAEGIWKLGNLVIVNNQECFTPQQVAEAQVKVS
jgi:hypothetical protein